MKAKEPSPDKHLPDTVVLSLLESVLMPEADAWEQEGSQIGDYRICEKLGDGGFGVVWRAEQSEPVRREVALKMIKAGMDSREVLARFEQERQVLAEMKHPNIAAMLDADMGPDGRPFFVMELVRGLPLTLYCLEKKLTLRQKLQLFKDVCLGVQHAHQKGVIHRDLKPSNILVTEVDGLPVPKIIDFGIAKAMTSRLTAGISLVTRLDIAIGTPLYMPPEQFADSTKVDTRSDVYALGAILYEIISGSPPFDSHKLTASGQDEMRRIIRYEQPMRPSRKLEENLKKQTSPHEQQRETFDRDLDSITLCALAKEQERRYATAAEFANDLQRYLDDAPVNAHPPTAAYIATRWIRRHQTAFIAACISILALITGTTLALWQAAEARREKLAAETQARRALEAEETARTQAQRALQTANFLTQMLDSAADEIEKGRNPEALTNALNQSRKVLLELKGDPVLQNDLLERVGKLYATIGDWSPAIDLYRSYADGQARIHGTDSDEAITAELDYLKKVANQGARATVPPQLEKLTQRLEKRGQRGSKLWFDIRREHSRVLIKLDDGPAALASSSATLAEAEKMKLKGRSMLNVQLAHAAVLEFAGQYDAALSLLETCRQQADPSTSSGDRLDVIDQRLLLVLETRGDHARAAQILRDKLEQAKAVPDIKADNLIQILDQLSDVESKARQHDLAISHAQESLQLARNPNAHYNETEDTRRGEIGHCLIRLAECESAAKKHDDAVRHAEEAHLLAIDQGSITSRIDTLSCLARVHKIARHLDEAYQVYDECRKLRESSNPNYKSAFTDTEEMLRIRLDQNRAEEALDLARGMWTRCLNDPLGKKDHGELGYIASMALKAWDALQKSSPSIPPPAELALWEEARAKEEQMDAANSRAAAGQKPVQPPKKD